MAADDGFVEQTEMAGMQGPWAKTTGRCACKAYVADLLLYTPLKRKTIVAIDSTLDTVVGYPS